MKKQHTRFAAIAALSILSAVAAHAGGSHAGGHGHGDHDQPTAIGQPGKASEATRTIQVDMSDNMRFAPESIQVRQGETVRFVVRNVGKIKHELVLGTAQDLKAHHEAMMKNPEMEHDDPNQITLAPGKSGEIVWKFSRAGEVPFGCLQPGHYSAGMKGEVKVSAAKKGAQQ